MRKAVYNTLVNLKNNKYNYLVYYKNNKRIEKKFCDLYCDILLTGKRFATLKQIHNAHSIGIIGPASYDWLCIDLTSKVFGSCLIAIPEFLTVEKTTEIIRDIKPDILLIDYSLQDKYRNIDLQQLYYFGTDSTMNKTDTLQILENVMETDFDIFAENRVQEIYSISFSSGTTDKIKSIKMRYYDFEKKVKISNLLKRLVNIIVKFIEYKQSFWSKKYKKIIIFMPFSHMQQRQFALLGLMYKVNILISDYKNCLRHLIIEKPNILIGVPVIYELLAAYIEAKIVRFGKFKKLIFKMFTGFKINTLKDSNFIKKAFNVTLLAKIRKALGSNPDYFVTGSAPISRHILDIFYKAGVRIYEGYGLSEVGNIALNDWKNFKLGSVGKPLQEIRFSEESEILVKYDEKIHDKHVLKIDNKAYIYTGDIGYLDKEGFLFLRGRIDDVIVLANGKKIYPEILEKKFYAYSFVEHAIVLTVNQRELYVVFTIRTSELPPTHWELKRIIENTNKSNLDHEHITRYYIHNQSFINEQELMTGNMKLKRKNIYEKFRNVEFIAI